MIRAFGAAFAWGCLASLLAIPAAHAAPHFPIPDALTQAQVWQQPDFRAAWVPQQASTPMALKVLPQPPPIFGRQPHLISARFQDETIQSITILFLDSGTHFGYIKQENAKQTEKENKERFQELYEDTLKAVYAGLKQMASRSSPQKGVIGDEAMLRQSVTLFELGDFTARLHAVDEQLVKVTLFPDGNSAKTWQNIARLHTDDRDWEKQFETRVTVAENGDHLLAEIPLFPQGDRAYCGVSSLAMAMQYLGLDVETEDYAAAAGIRYGSTRGSKIREVYDAAADEAGMRMTRKLVFDFERARKSIDAGIPVLVWRRWTQERDYLHRQFSRRFATDPKTTLPEPNADDRRLWPGKEDYSHASVLTGYNLERREIIFTESWSEAARNRRMRIEEMEGTAYYTFYLRF